MLKHFNEFGFFDKLAVHMSSNHLIICYILVLHSVYERIDEMCDLWEWELGS